MARRRTRRGRPSRREVVPALGLPAALDPVVPPDRVAPDDRVVAGLVDQGGAVVVLEHVVLDAEVVVVGVRPQPGSAVVVHPVAAYVGAVDGPELDASGAAAALPAPLPVVGVVADDLVALDHQAADTAAALVRVHAVLAVAAQTAGADLLVSARHQSGTGVVLDRGVLDHPPVGRVVVDHALVRRRDEALHGQMADGDVAGAAAERVLVLLAAVEHRARRAEVAVPLLGDDLGVAVRVEPVLARPQPERGVRGLLLVFAARSPTTSGSTVTAPAGAFAGPAAGWAHTRATGVGDGVAAASPRRPTCCRSRSPPAGREPPVPPPTPSVAF